MNNPDELQYTKEHEWIRVDRDIVVIGITHYAQDQLGEIVFVELPNEGEEFGKGDVFGVIESVKSANDIFSPLTCEVIEVNDPLADSPEAINDDPYGEGWIIKVKALDPTELDELLSAEEYEAYVQEEAE